MEFLLLWIDDLDDVFGALRHMAPKILGFLFAMLLFAVTGFALTLAPQATLAVTGLVLSASLLGTVRRRRVERARQE
jgi:uncharacterized membrane protein